MTKRLIFTGNFNLGLLMDELLEKFPEWIIADSLDPSAEACLLGLEYNSEEVRLSVPIDANEKMIANVIHMHNPNKPSKLERIESQRRSDQKNAVTKLMTLGLTEDDIEALWPRQK